MSEQLSTAKIILESQREHIETLRDSIARMNEEIERMQKSLETSIERAALVDYKISLLERGLEI